MVGLWWLGVDFALAVGPVCDACDVEYVPALVALPDIVGSLDDVHADWA